MEQSGKPLAVILGLTALGVFVNFVFAPFYADVLDVESIWFVLNWFMTFAVIVALVTAYGDKRSADASASDAKTYIAANAAFYAAAVLAVLYLSNWINELVVGGGNEGDVRLFFWGLIDTLFVVLMARMSVRLWAAR